MDFHQLKIFVEVARQKNFSRAAEIIFLSQPTVSAHIKALEDEIGAPLFDRSQRELQLTGSGKILFKYACELLEIKEKALWAIQEEHRIVKGNLQIAASSVPGAYLLPGLLYSFHQKYPGITFSVPFRDTNQVIEDIQDYTCDLGFTGEPGNQEGLGHIMLVEDDLILIAPLGTNLPIVDSPASGIPGAPGFGIPTTELKYCLKMPFILREPGSATRQVFEKALKEHSQENNTLNVTSYIESQEAIKEAVKKGLGLTVISMMAVREELKAKLLEGYKLRDLPLKRNFYLVYRKKRILPPLSRTFFDFTLEYFQKPVK